MYRKTAASLTFLSFADARTDEQIELPALDHMVGYGRDFGTHARFKVPTSVPSSGLFPKQTS